MKHLNIHSLKVINYVKASKAVNMWLQSPRFIWFKNNVISFLRTFQYFLALVNHRICRNCDKLPFIRSHVNKIFKSRNSHNVFKLVDSTGIYWKETLLEGEIRLNKNRFTFGTTVYTDSFLNHASFYNPFVERVAYLVEARPTAAYLCRLNPYTWIENNYSLFSEVWTHEDKLINLIPQAKWIPLTCTWIDLKDRKIHVKHKNCSFIASDKNFLEGHKLRQEIRKHLPKNVDIFGKGFNWIENKVLGLGPYRFSVTVENCCVETYFTEKLIDCFLTGTIPIYWGTRKIQDHFDMNGIIIFNNIEELLTIISDLSENLYHLKTESVLNNFRLAHQFISPQVWLRKKSVL